LHTSRLVRRSDYPVMRHPGGRYTSTVQSWSDFAGAR
jgi:hypothetical protein